MNNESNEFNPEDYAPEYVVVGANEQMSSILGRVEEALARTPYAMLVIPRGAIAFHTTHDLLALGKLQDRRDLRVSIASHDPIVIGLGRVLGFHVIDPPPDHPALASDPIMGSAPGDVAEQATAPLPLGTTPFAPEWVFVPTLPPRSSATSTWLGSSGDAPMVWQSPDDSIPHSALRTPHSESPNATTNFAVVPGAPPAPPTETLLSMPGGISPPAVLTPTGSLKARRGAPKAKAVTGDKFRYGGRLNAVNWRRFAAVTAAVLAIALVGGSLYAYAYLPEGSVEVTTLSRDESNMPVEVSVITSTSGQSSDISTKSVEMDTQTGPTISAAKISVPLVEEGARPATGSRQVPKGKGGGTMVFTNRTGSVVSVPAGLEFKAPNGVTVQTTQGGTVPATVFGASFGTLALPVVASVEGPDGNIAEGQISGVWQGTLNYSNRAMQGGGTETVKVVRQEDVDALVAELRQKAESRAAGEILGMVGAGRQLITQTVTLANAQFAPLDHKAGEDGDSVRVKFTADALAYAYKESEMHDSIAQAMLDSVQTTIPLTVGPSLDLGSVDYSPPAVVAVEPGRVAFRTGANGRVTYSLTPALTEQIRTLIKGKKIAEARNLILQNYGAYLNPDSIEAKVLWFNLNTLPNDPSRINVQPTR